MKNTEKDYITQLRSDYIPTKKNNSDQSRRPFNPGDPKELLFMPAGQPAITEENALSFSESIAVPAIVY